ncbi:hypothetical protein CYMTET_28211 [Cymbomonas tetramitiformis]|uniref:DNA-directed RNA polymerase III subunit RPC6 n=1 Tax=Cymbomonas tetramitiformis TaxID=36881 RepID=A0AAE0FNL2_9CHLO|nr:hypothetical protein CYMTET_28211 [Cymbomonas tetramitiformis]
MASAGGNAAVVEKILQITANYPDGIKDEELSQKLGVEKTNPQKMMALNQLLSKGKLDLFKSNMGEFVYKQNMSDMTRFKGCNKEDMIIYQLIKAVGAEGIWTKDLRFKSNLTQPQMTKALKVLESKQLIKAVKSVTTQNRKVYMLFELEPSKELTGGAWYTEQEFDAEFIEVLRGHCLKYIEHQGRATLDEVVEFVSSSGLSKVELRPEDILQVLHTLMFDGKMDSLEAMTMDQDEEVYYFTATLDVPTREPLTAVPCGVCPVAHECREDGVISPATCVYYTQWLEGAGSLEW